MASRKGKKRNGRRKAEFTSDEDSISNDACSYGSGPSDRSMFEDANYNEVDNEILIQDKLGKAIDGFTQKSSKGRITCFDDVEKIFIAKYIPDFVNNWKMTILNAVEHSLKKGRGQEQIIAARLSTLLCIQLSLDDEIQDLKSILICIANDNTAAAHVRAECCWTLAMNQFLLCNDTSDDLMEIAQLLSSIFADSYLKNSKDKNSCAFISTELAALHVAAISSWSLLLTVLPSANVYTLLSSTKKIKTSHMPSLQQLCELLKSPHLDIRLAAGEALAVIFEVARDFSCDYEEDWTSDLIEILQDLATDSNKHRAKKDRKQQRANFRDILHYIEKDIVPEMSVKFGYEVLDLKGWCMRTQYNAFCRLLGPGINIHLAENYLLRDIFQLGSVSKQKMSKKQSKSNKLEKTLMNAAACKARTIQRNKHRDKRFVL